jgi:hypothetical protein
MKALLPLLFISLSAVNAHSASIDITLELPRLDAAEYHAPYVAIWLQSGTREVTNLALWYDLNMRNEKGLEWLKDLRQWWRRSGRNVSFPADGFTGATRTAGTYNLHFEDSQFAFSSLPAGEYTLNLEAVREVGGRELLSLPLRLPIIQTLDLSLKGESELGRVIVQLKP